MNMLARLYERESTMAVENEMKSLERGVLYTYWHCENPHDPGASVAIVL